MFNFPIDDTQGKTLQTIAAILDNRPILQHSKPGAKHPPGSPDLENRRKEDALWATARTEWHEELDMAQVPKTVQPKKFAGARAGTLVVCPVIALSQWKTEIEKFTFPDVLSVGIYHGPNRAKEMTPQLLQKYDVVLTTFQVLEQDFRKMVSPNKVTCPNCGGKFKLDKLRVHLKYFCGEGAQRTEAQQRQRRGQRRGGRGGGRPGGNGGRGNAGKKKGNQKATLAKTATRKTKTTTVAKQKKVVRVQSSSKYDSDSELSIDQDYVEVSRSRRPSRSAAVRASRQVKRSLKSWSGEKTKSRNMDDDESSYSSDHDEETSSSEDSDAPVTKYSRKVKAAPITRDSSGSSDEEDSAVGRAREKQRKALQAVKKQKKKAPKKKAAANKSTKNAKSAKKKAQRRKGKKKFDDSDSSDDSSGSDGDDGQADDPLAGIDLDELAEEALAGARFSLLHSFCW